MPSWRAYRGKHWPDRNIRVPLEGLMALGRKMLLLAAFCGLAWGQTGLTTIQDTLFQADGTLFNGTLTIQWSTFDATNIGTIVQQSTSVAVVNGNLLVRLAPDNT